MRLPTIEEIPRNRLCFREFFRLNRGWQQPSSFVRKPAEKAGKLPEINLFFYLNWTKIDAIVKPCYQLFINNFKNFVS